jgi:hypothetical protein
MAMTGQIKRSICVTANALVWSARQEVRKLEDKVTNKEIVYLRILGLFLWASRQIRVKSGF